MIRLCTEDDVPALYDIINDAANAYRGKIPDDCWHEPYMSLGQLGKELAAGVVFWGHEEGGKLTGVMGIQHVQDVSLIRHAYVRTACRSTGDRWIAPLPSQIADDAAHARRHLGCGQFWAIRFMKSTDFIWSTGREEPAAREILVHHGTADRDVGSC